MDPVLLVRCDPEETFGVAPSALAAADVPVAVWEAIDGDPRPSLEGTTGVVVFGSSYNVDQADEHPLIKEVRELTLDAIDRGIPYLGICFGAQLLAWSLGREVVRAPVREVGYEPIRPTAAAVDDPLVGHYAEGDRVFQWHMDTYELPEGATLLATGDRVRNQAYRVGDRTWGVQWHLDVDRPEVDLWLGSFEQQPGHDLEAMWGKAADVVRAEADRFHATHERDGRETIARFARFARSAPSTT
ncbi:MAG TPA: type 1 glutamine amidotransferase [Actinomycetota bacterium]|jgi:GMP synthase (glutamine-hydrolysing)|nr:type 1 glutamine amidotransferase [Actinomycetota bacterium]